MLLRLLSSLHAQCLLRRAVRSLLRKGARRSPTLAPHHPCALSFPLLPSFQAPFYSPPLPPPPHLPHLNLVPIYNHPLRNAIDNLREIALARFSLGRRVGTGASENVYEGSIDWSRRVAVLRMKRGAASLDEEACMLLKLSRHANLVRSWVSCNQGGEPLIVTELAQHGSVLSHGGGTR